ncbi:EamA family transporter [candidate division WOR-3 bacterium]|nr:EamA family transporter [candidate division WOR-3 bacterium]
MDHEAAQQTSTIDMTGLAFLLVIMSAMLHAPWNFLTKMVSGNLSVLYIGLSGTCVLLPTPYVFMKRRGELSSAWKENKRHSIAIGLGATAGYLLILYVFRMAQVSYVVAAREFSVVFGSILGMLYRRESLSVRKVVSIAMVVAGLVLIRIA